MRVFAVLPFLLLSLCVSADQAATKDERPVILTREESAASPDAGSTTHKFESDVNKMMKLIVNSLYKTKEIFLRELISVCAPD
jgi:heat shock protein beta